MITTIKSGYVKKYDYDWRVLEFTDTNGSLPVYAVERNQGEHDGRFFIVSVTPSKELALHKADMLFGGK